MINKTELRKIIEKNSKRTSIESNVTKYIDSICKRLVYAIIELDNESLTPSSKKTITKECIDNAISEVDSVYGLVGLTDAKKIETSNRNINGNYTQSANQEIDINLNIQVETD